MKIGILQCGRVPDDIIGKHGDYDEMFANLLGRERFNYETWPVLDDVLPGSVYEANGWLITGSKYGVYEDHIWIPKLEAFLRHAYASGLPIIGICFGHQILAQALGGKVELFSAGWSVGHVAYTINGVDNSTGVHAFHQDQIIELPPDATSFGSTDFCQYAFLKYGDRAMSIQPHPEFSDDFLTDLLGSKGDILPGEVQQKALESIGQPLDSSRIGVQMADFFQARHKQR